MNQEPARPDRMSEAEVSLRFAFWLVREKLVSDEANDVLVALDSAQVKVGQVSTFDVVTLLREHHWRKTESTADWRGAYGHVDTASRLVLGFRSGKGDVVCRLQDGRVLRADSKRGPLTHRGNSEEHRMLREALGQLLTRNSASKQDLLAVAVPYNPTFARLASFWREAPLIKQLRIHILTVGRDDKVDGLTAWSLERFRKQQDNTAVQATLDDTVKGVFCAVSPAPDRNDYPAYVNFARAGKRTVKQWPPGYQRDTSMAEMVDRWTARGCLKELLLRIAKACFDWVPPEDRPVNTPAD